MTTLTQKEIEHRMESVVDYGMKCGVHSRTTDPRRASFLRVSSLPFCSRQFFLSTVGSLASHAELDARMMYYVSVGSLVHEIFQEALSILSDPSKLENLGLKAFPHRAVLVQDWICRECHNRHVFVPRPNGCEWCGHHKLDKAETTVTFSEKILGHMDGCLAFPSEPNDRTYSKSWVHIPLDYKTSTMAAVEGRSKELPYPDNVSQLETYGTIKYFEGYNVPMIALIYISRDNPFKRKVCAIPVDPHRVRKGLLAQERQFNRTWEVIRDPSLEEALKLPTVTDKDFESNCGFCRMVPSCTRAARGDTEMLEAHIKSRVMWLKSASFNNRFDFPTD